MQNVTVFCFLASYAVAFAADGAAVWGREKLWRMVSWAAAFAGVFAHTWFLFERSRSTGTLPVLSGPRDWLLVLAWVAVAFHLLSTGLERRAAVGLFLWPLVLALVGVTYLLDPAAGDAGASAAGEPGVGGWVFLHATLFLLGSAGVTAGVVLSAMYLVQHRRLRTRKPTTAGLRLFSLERLDRWNRWAVAAAVPLLALGVMLGYVLTLTARGAGRAVTLWDPLVIGVTAGLLLAAALLGGVLGRKRPAGRGVAVRSLLACGFLLVTLTGLQVLADGPGTLMESWHGDAGKTRTEPTGTPSAAPVAPDINPRDGAGPR